MIRMADPIVTSEPARPVTPLGIAVNHLATVMRFIEDMPDFPVEMAVKLQEAIELVAGLENYMSECTTEESAALQAIAQRTRMESWQQHFTQGDTVRPLEQEMLSGHVEGQLLKMLVHATRAKRVLDIGMFTGYSALAMAEALPLNGYLIACEVDPYVAELAQSMFQESSHGFKVQVEVGSALETLHRLAAAREMFDLVFIDADKQEYVQYFQTLLDMNLLTPRGIICVDNTLFQGQVYLPEAYQSANGRAIAAFNRVVADDPRVEQVLLPIRDGLTLIRQVVSALEL